jgi:hypothetical protein
MLSGYPVSGFLLMEGRPPAMEGSWEYVRSEVFVAVTMKNDVFWDIKSQFVKNGVF